MHDELIDIGNVLGIPFKDVCIIFDVISAFSGTESYSHLKHHLIHIFKEDIRPEHYIILGHIIGYCIATDQERYTIEQQTHYQSCLRQN